MFEDQLHPDWVRLLSDQLPLLREISQAVLQDSLSIPAQENVMRVFALPPKSYRVLIVGQDPYPNPEHALGLSFAVPNQTAVLPPSLKNILRELADDLGPEFVSDGDITAWSQRGVMLLNRHLTTRSHQSGAHFDLGWDLFTDAVVERLQEESAGKLVAILWGDKAQQLAPKLSGSVVIASPHPSPLSAYRGFFGSKPFSRCNKALLELGLNEIDWSA